MDWEFLIENGILNEICSYLNFLDVIKFCKVSLLFNTNLNQESIWRSLCLRLFRNKKFVPKICLRLMTPGNNINQRKDLEAMKISELKKLVLNYRLDQKNLVEKQEYIELINKFELKHILPNEPLAKFALRLAWLDRKRNRISKEELCELEWSIRVRNDGPLGVLALKDPYWQDVGETGKAKFSLDGKFELNFPRDYNPFYQMQNAVANITWSFEQLQHTVVIGVPQVLARHPYHWGWVMISGGCIFTGFPLPPRNSKESNLLKDTNIENLISPKIISGMWKLLYE